MSPEQIVIVSISVIIATVIFSLIRFLEKKASKQSELQKYEDYVEFIKPPHSLPKEFHDQGSLLGVWDNEGVEMRQIRKEFDDPLAGLLMINEALKKGSLDEYFRNVLIPHSDILSIRRVIHFVGTSRNKRYNFYIEIRGVNDVIKFNAREVDGKILSSLINDCLFFNQDIEIDKVVMDVLVNEKMPLLYSFEKESR